MASDARARLKEWLSSGQAKLHPLTFQQRELWETSPVAPGDPANHICSYFEVQGPITFERCKSAMVRVVERHEALRTSFLPGKERPLQIVRAVVEPVEPAMSYRRLEEGDDIDAIMEESFRKPFDFMRGPLYRFDMLQRGEGDFVAAFTIHHAVGDGWTLGAFIEDLCTAYILEMQDAQKEEGQRQLLPDLAMSHTAWGAVERAKWVPAEIAKHADFWKRRLEGAQGLFAAETDRTGRLDKWITDIPADLSASLRALSKRTGATLFNTVLAAFQIALRRWKGVSDITVGSPVANRRDAVVKDTMGYFAGIVPLRGKVDEAIPFADYVRVVQEQTMDAFAHAIPFAELAALLGESSTAERHAIFDTRFALQNHPIPDVELPGITTLLRTVSTGTVRFDLACELTEVGDGFEVVWLHRSSVVTEEKLRELDTTYRGVLESVCKSP